MKHYYCLLLAIAGLLSSCGINPEKEYQKIMQQTIASLEEIQNDASNLSPYELTNKIKESQGQFDSTVGDLMMKLQDDEEKKSQLYAIMQEFSSIEQYKVLIKVLTDKNISILKEIKERKWINSETNDTESIFSIDAQKLSFLNLNKKFPYSIVDGNFDFDEECDISPIFFVLDGTELMLIDYRGNKAIYREANTDELMLGRWKDPNTSGGQYGGIGITLNPDGKGAKFGYRWENVTYKVNGNTISVYNSITKDNDKYVYVPQSDKMNLCFDNGYVYGTYIRVKSKGPDCLQFLFDGNKEMPEDDMPDIQVSSSKSSKSTGGEDWDAILDEYERYTDKCISYVKKAANGDMSALSDMASLMESAESLGDKLEKASDNLSVAQAARYTRITAKLASVMAEM